MFFHSPIKVRTPGGGEADQAKFMSNVVTTTHYMYQGPLGQVVRRGVSYFASKDGFPLGTYSTFEEAMESLVWKGRVKATWDVYNGHSG